MKYSIKGTVLPILEIELNQGESVFTESGGMAWMSPNISMNTTSAGGLGKMIGRAFSGESLFIVEYTATSGTGLISFCMETPGKIIPFQMDGSKKIICQRDAFMTATPGIDLKMRFNKKIGAGLFGGEGFFLQEVSGSGIAFLEISGEVTEHTLEENQSLIVDPGYIGAFEESVKYDITVTKGIKNMLFSGEGIFLATLTGPGKVWLQSMPFSNLARKVAAYVPRS